MKITSKGQITIPKKIREQLGLLPNTEVALVVEPNGIRIVKAGYPFPGKGKLAIELLQRAKSKFTMTTDEIMALTRGDE